MRTVPVRSTEPVDAAFVQQVAEAFEARHTLAHLMRWSAAQVPRVQIAEIITQDEYTHDVVLPFGSVFLSFDTT
jgi:hypothetical protein